GCTRVAPPTIPRDIGSSSSPTRFPESSLVHVLIERYCPSRAAYACAPASTARQSLPVAMITGSIPFIIPLLRSEEHTSELQSRFDLVCRLLLEKKIKLISMINILRLDDDM